MCCARLGSAEAVRAILAPKSPPPKVEGLLLSALALLWDAGPGQPPAPYADHTVVDQAVSAVRKRLPASAGFVNAVLRRFLRERTALQVQVGLGANGAVAMYNHPLWWIERLQADWPEAWAALLLANNQHPPMTLRVNARQGTAEAYLQRLQQAGIAAHAIGPQAPQALLLGACGARHGAAGLRRRRGVGARRSGAAGGAPCWCERRAPCRPWQRARGCLMPARRPAARPPICWSSASWICWRWTAMPSA